MSETSAANLRPKLFRLTSFRMFVGLLQVSEPDFKFGGVNFSALVSPSILNGNRGRDSQ